MTAALADPRTGTTNDPGTASEPAGLVPTQGPPRRPRLVPLPDYDAPTADGTIGTTIDAAAPTEPPSTPPAAPGAARSPSTVGHTDRRAAAAPGAAPIPSAPPIQQYHVPAHPALSRRLPSDNPLPPRRRRFEVRRISASTGPMPGDEPGLGGDGRAGFGAAVAAGVPAALLAAARPAAPPPTMPRALPSALSTGTMLGRAIVEALSGRRPVEQLQPFCATGVFTGLQELPMLGGRRQTHLVNTWVCEPAAKVAEVSVAFRCGGFTRAMAFRMVASGRNWQITELQVG